MSNRLKIIAYSIGAWIIALAFIFIIPIPIISGFAGLLCFIVGFFMLTLALISLVKDKDKVSSLLAILLVVIVTWLAISKGFDWGARVHFHLYRSTYEAKVAKVLSVNDRAEREKICGEECWIMSSDSNRVAFHYVHGFLNWQDIVYDPTGAVMAQDWDTKKRLDNYLRGAEHLSGNWYVVYFGD
jgi:hypothetical protein